MNSTKLASIGLAAALAAVLPAVPAQATPLTRTFVSSAGSDSNPCSITLPCATFAHAYGLTLSNGIVTALDPGKYGPLSITGPITIDGNGWAAITAPATGNGISISAGSGNVTLTGLNIVAMDFNTVSPPQDVNGMAAHLCAHMMMEAMVLLAHRLGLVA